MIQGSKIRTSPIYLPGRCPTETVKRLPNILSLSLSSSVHPSDLCTDTHTTPIRTQTVDKDCPTEISKQQCACGGGGGGGKAEREWREKQRGSQTLSSNAGMIHVLTHQFSKNQIADNKDVVSNLTDESPAKALVNKTFKTKKKH